jgi:hypothetical protein
VADKKGRGPVRLVGPVSLPGLSLGDVLLGLTETGEGRGRTRPPDEVASTTIESDPLLGGFWRRDRAAGLAAPRLVTRRKAPACKLHQVEMGRVLYAGVLKAAGTRASAEAAPGTEFRYRSVPLCKMTAEELAAAGTTTTTCSGQKSRKSPAYAAQQSNEPCASHANMPSIPWKGLRRNRRAYS